MQQPLRYMARELDPITGLYYVRNRWYDPVANRIVSEDPIGLAGGINTYAYVGNNPTNLRDPSGLEPNGGDCDDARALAETGMRCPVVATAKRWGAYVWSATTRGAERAAGAFIEFRNDNIRERTELALQAMERGEDHFDRAGGSCHLYSLPNFPADAANPICIGYSAAATRNIAARNAFLQSQLYRLPGVDARFHHEKSCPTGLQRGSQGTVINRWSRHSREHAAGAHPRSPDAPRALSPMQTIACPLRESSPGS